MLDDQVGTTTTSVAGENYASTTERAMTLDVEFSAVQTHDHLSCQQQQRYNDGRRSLSVPSRTCVEVDGG